jgi:hypothetical protein
MIITPILTNGTELQIHMYASVDYPQQQHSATSPQIMYFYVLQQAVEVFPVICMDKPQVLVSQSDCQLKHASQSCYSPQNYYLTIHSRQNLILIPFHTCTRNRPVLWLEAVTLKQSKDKLKFHT